MNDFSSNIIIGIIAGLLATLLTVGFRRVWISILVPWFEELVYKDAKIEGIWYSIPEELEDERYDVIALKRSGHHVEARMTCSAGNDSGKCYSIVGSFRNLILSATYETEDRRGLDRGSMTLMLTENGKKLVGYLACYGDQDHEISDTPVTWYSHKVEFDKDYKERLEQIKEEEGQELMGEFLKTAKSRRKKKAGEKDQVEKPKQLPESKLLDVHPQPESETASAPPAKAS